MDEQGEALNRKLRGHYQYYGRPTNYQSLKYYRAVRRIWKKWLKRRTGDHPDGLPLATLEENMIVHWTD
ncbi:hypothetical protein MYX78_07185 [Acidobacteria bacterium AH-259-G07]|nr:hypothetical protein [Acidobacteria bacterium AH-259-G07]